MTTRTRSKQGRRGWIRAAAATALACWSTGGLTPSVGAQDFTPLPAVADVAPTPVVPQTVAAPPLLVAPPVDPFAEAMPAATVAPAATVVPTAHEAAPGNYSNAELEARLRALEADYEAQKMRYASLVAESADGKSGGGDAPKGTVVGSDLKMSGGWKDGAHLETADKAFKMKWRGRTQFDTIAFGDSQDYFRGLGGNQGDATVDFRRLRLGAEGVFYEQFDFAVELDFINSFNTNGSTNALANNNNMKNAFDRQFFGVPAPTDVWVGIKEVPLFGYVRIGNIKPVNGLEHSNSSRFLDFMERSLNQDLFVGRFNNGFQPGALFIRGNEAQTATYAMSFAKNSYNVFAYDSGGFDIASRLTWTPIYDEEAHGRYMVHVGCSVTERQCTDGQDRLRARGTLRNGISQSWSNVADTTIFFSSYETLIIPELAAVYGPWHFQAEYFGQWNQDVRIQGAGAAPNPGPSLGTAYFQGYYAQLSYFLTGEHREYERKAGAFGRVVPHENFYLLRGKHGPLRTRGAWQILYRYCLVDLNDPRLANVNAVGGGASGVGGGTVYDHTIGLNHFLNPNMKIQYNFVIADRTASAATPAIAGQTQTGGTSYGFGVRAALDF